MIGNCPYYIRERDRFVYCELVRFTFSDNIVRRNVLYRYCANINGGYNDCPYKKELDKYYERTEELI